MARKYTGNSDGLSKNGAKPGLTLFMKLAQKRWGFTNLGSFSNRAMNNSAAKADPKNPKYLSVHATGRACDLGYKDRKAAVQAWDWFMQYTKELGIEISGVHRLRANYAQNKYSEFLAQGMDEYGARQQISELLGHARIDVTYKYVPKEFMSPRVR